MIRFLHTSDWQLGMTRHFFSEGTQERYTQDRFDAIRTMGRIAKEEKCQFMLVCGDTFESNQVDRKTVARAMEALKEVPVPVYMIPGNHDPLNAASVYRSSTLIDRKPDHVHVIESAIPISPCEGVEIVGAPWLSKRPAVNPFQEILTSLSPTDGITRICMAHGIIDLFTPDKDAPALITVDAVERAIMEGKAHYIALGDRHSLTRIGGSDSIWYSGTPESTDFSETQSGYAQIVEIDEGRITAKAVQVGQWNFIERERVDLNTLEDVDALRRTLEDMGHKELTVIRLNLVGSLSLSAADTLQKHLTTARDVFGAFDVREDELHVFPEDADFNDLCFSGFAESTVATLREKMAEGKDQGSTARDSLMLLVRLARGVA